MRRNGLKMTDRTWSKGVSFVEYGLVDFAWKLGGGVLEGMGRVWWFAGVRERERERDCVCARVCMCGKRGEKGRLDFWELKGRVEKEEWRGG